MALLRAGLSHRVLAIVAEAYEVSRHELIRDARTAWTWQGSADHLVVHVARQHGWPAELTVSYLAALRHARMWNQPDRGLPAAVRGPGEELISLLRQPDWGGLSQEQAVQLVAELPT